MCQIYKREEGVKYEVVGVHDFAVFTIHGFFLFCFVFI